METAPAETSANTSAASKRPRYFENRYLRFFIGAIIVIVVVMVLGFAGWSMYKSSRSQPLNVDPYPGATLISSGATERGDRTLYSTQDSVQKVLDFYSSKFPKDDTNGCKKIYTDKQPSEEPGHYFGRCIVDNSFGDAIQWTSITINYQTQEKVNIAKTIIEVSRDWGR